MSDDIELHTVLALANKIARIVWATWNHQRAYDGNWGSRHGELH